MSIAKISNIKSYVILLLIFSSFSCSFKNAESVKIFIESVPEESELSIDGKYYGLTPTTILISPSSQYSLSIKKRGYKSYKFDLVSRIGPRLDPEENIRCLVDASTSFLIVPMIPLYSTRCRDFEYRFHKINLQEELAKVPNLNLSDNEVIRDVKITSSDDNKFTNNDQKNTPATINNSLSSTKHKPLATKVIKKIRKFKLVIQ